VRGCRARVVKTTRKLCVCYGVQPCTAITVCASCILVYANHDMLHDLLDELHATTSRVRHVFLPSTFP
jgi:hypothetical protein